MLQCFLVVKDSICELAKVVVCISEANYSLELIFINFEGLKVVFDSFFDLIKFVANVGKSYESKGKPVVHLQSSLYKLSSSFKILQIVVNNC